MAIGGRAVARFDGLVVFVAGAAPGDRALVQVTAAKKNYAEADLVTVLSPGPSRIVPPCPYLSPRPSGGPSAARTCGGCSWQHIAYPEQLRQKKMLLQSALDKQSGFIGAAVRDVAASPGEFRYRNRIQLHREPGTPTGLPGKIGFRARRSEDVVDVEDCLIAEEALAREIATVRAEVAAGRADPPPRFELRLRTSGTEFGQVNSAQNAVLVDHVVERFQSLAGANALEFIWDLYAGAGNFTFPLADAFPQAQIRAVELDLGAVTAGIGQARARGDERRIRFDRSAVENWLAGARIEGRTAALLDPPRVGCDPSAIAALTKLNLDFLLYVSCHPITLARDLRTFHEAGWRLQDVAPFDMFPQTDHIESVSCLLPPTP